MIAQWNKGLCVVMLVAMCFAGSLVYFVPMYFVAEILGLSDAASLNLLILNMIIFVPWIAGHLPAIIAKLDKESDSLGRG